MRIAHIIPQFPYFEGGIIIGGHASPLLALARGQASAGDDITILSYVPGRMGKIEISENLCMVSLFAKATPGSIRFGLRFLGTAIFWAWKNRKKFDVVHVHSGFADYVMVAFGVKTLARIPTLHTLYCPMGKPSEPRQKSVISSLLRACMSRLDKMTAISKNIVKSIEDPELEGRMQVIPPALDLKRFSPPQNTLVFRQKFGIPVDHVAVLFVGNAKAQKNLISVLRAFSLMRKRYPKCRLLITTELSSASPDRLLRNLADEIQLLGIGDCITQFGIIDNMPDLIRSCDILIAPFLDSFGPSDYFMAVLEAMACGKATIVSAVGGMSEVVDLSVGRLVDPKNLEEITRSMSELVADRDLRETLGRHARKRAEELFATEKSQSRYSEIYAQMMIGP